MDVAMFSFALIAFKTSSVMVMSKEEAGSDEVELSSERSILSLSSELVILKDENTKVSGLTGSSNVSDIVPASISKV